jgi:hypothetical protein
MSTPLRRVRGLFGIGLTWGALWAAVGALVVVIVGYVRPADIDPGEGPLVAAAVLGITGFVSGLAFGGLLSVGERRNTLLKLSLIRVALWGTLGAAVVPLLTGVDNSMVFITCPLGATLATLSVALARRAELRDADQSRLLP